MPIIVSQQSDNANTIDEWMQWLLKHRLAETAGCRGISNQNTGENKSSLKLGITLLLKFSVGADRMDGSPLNQNDLLNLIVVIREEFAFVYGGL